MFLENNKIIIFAISAIGDFTVLVFADLMVHSQFLSICSNLIKMGSLELGLSRVPMSADFIDPLYTESSHSAEGQRGARPLFGL